MAQYFYDLGENAPTLNVGGAAIQPLSIAGLTAVSFQGLTDFNLVNLGKGFDSRLNKPVLISFPIDNPDGAVSNVWTRFCLITPNDVGDFEALVKFRSLRAGDFGNNSYYSGGCGIIFRAKDYDAGMGSSIDFSDGGVVFAAGSIGDNSFNTVGRTMRLYSATYTSVNAATTSNTYLPANSPTTRNRLFYTLRVKLEGRNIKARAWREDETEPSSWGIDVTFNDLPLTGRLGVCFDSWLEGRVLDFFSYGTDGDPPPLSYPGGNRIVRGSVLTPDSSPAVGYVVRCYHRSTGALLGETVSDLNGEFSFSLPLPATERVYCLAVDQLGNTWNATIKDLIQPVSP